jgi:hypothetical protein
MAGTASLDLTSVQALRDYVEDFSDDLIVQGFYGHKTALYSTPHENVKGKKYLNTLLISDLARRYSKQFSAPNDVIKFKPRAIITEDAKVELEIYPKDFETSYLGKKRKKGQGMDIPFEGEIMGQVMARLAQEFDIAHLQAVETQSPASTDLMKQVFNGLFKVFDQIQADGHAPLATPSGGITELNILDICKDLIDNIAPGYNEGDLQIFMNKRYARMFQNAWTKKYVGQKASITWTDKVKTIETEEGDAKVIVLPSWNSNRIVCTPPGNFHHGFDDQLDWSQFNFLQFIRCIKFWMDFKFGVQVIVPDEDALMFTQG